MSKEYALWKHDLRQALSHLRYINFYLGNGPDGAERSGAEFREAMTLLYSECQFESFFALRAWQQAGLDEEKGQQFEVLKTLIDGFDEPDTDANILAHPQWHKILQKARELEDFLA